MPEIVGVIRSLGPSTSKLTNVSEWVRYSYVEVGDRVLKKMSVRHALTGPLEEAVESGQPATVFIVGNILCGVRLHSGRAFGSEVIPLWGAALMVLVCAMIGPPFILGGLYLIVSALGSIVRGHISSGLGSLAFGGAILGAVGWFCWVCFAYIKAKVCARRIPNVTII